MKPESAAYLWKSREFLAKTQDILDSRWPDEAGRAAYLAGFHAAQTLIFENTGRTAKTHSGVQSEFARLVKDDPHFDIDLRRFLARAYNLKAIADYETSQDTHVTPEQAAEAIEMAGRFVAVVVALIPPNGAS